MRRKIFACVVGLGVALTAAMLWIPSSSAHKRFGSDTLQGTWVFAESYWGSGQEAAYVGTIRFIATGSCEMTWRGIKTQGGLSEGDDTCTFDVAPDGSGTIIPDSADDIYFQIAQHGARIEYIVNSQNVGQVGRGSMTRR